MTTWTNIPDADIDQDSPVTQPLMSALRDNPIALAEGDPSSPGIYGNAVQRDYRSPLPVVTVSAGDNSSAQGQGFAEGTTTTNSTSDVVAARYTIKSYTGVLRFVAAHSFSITANPGSILSIYKNNVLIQTYYNNTNSSVTRTNDVSISPGDVIEWRHRSGIGAYFSSVTSFSVRADNPYISQAAYRLLSEDLSI